ncbi:rhomboid family intramembrane serine protease [bacterium]|nr:rhomboid family intramembrane serine protease [bacterium]
MNYRYRSFSMGFGRRLTPAVKYLIIFNASFFLVQEILRIDWFFYLGLVPALVWKGYVWQLASYMFLHGSFMHILLNMFVLWMFGTQLESFWGTKEFLKYYFLTGIGAGLTQAVVNSSSIIPVIGASGSIYGLLLAYGLTFPNSVIYLYFLLPIKAKYFVIIFGVIEFLATINPRGDAVAHLAHLGGMVIGLIYLKRHTGVKLIARSLKDILSKRRYKREVRDYHYEQQIRQEVDDLLDKINQIGLENLSKKERRRLDDASRFLRERAKRYQKEQSGAD